MPTFKIDPWPEEGEVELCGSTYCFQLRDRGHRMYAYYHEFDDKKNVTLDISLQKAEGYKEFAKKMLNFILPPRRLEEHLQFSEIYQSAVALFKTRKKVSINSDWEDGDIRAHFNVLLSEKSATVNLRAVGPPHSLYYGADMSAERQEDALRHMAAEAAGLYELFREYVKKSNQVKEKA